MNLRTPIHGNQWHIEQVCNSTATAVGVHGEAKRQHRLGSRRLQHLHDAYTDMHLAQVVVGGVAA